jgi:putative ABC transport system ATP-binding protein/lipoprotein-releasing system ATP-binding protein
MALIQANNLHRSYLLGKKELKVLRGVNLEVEAGEKVFLCGPSGAGKTTLMYTLAGLERPEQGQVTIEGRDIYTLPAKEQASFRNRTLGYIFQSFFLLPELSALENVMIPSLINGKQTRERAKELLEQVGLGKRLDHLPAELSGGEQQRVAIARALSNEPKIIFADEPTGNLDSRNGAEVMGHLFELSDRIGATLVIVTHDRELAKTGDRTLIVSDGVIE